MEQEVLNRGIISELRDMGDDFLKEITEKFFEDADADIAALRKHIAKGEGREIGIAAHGLKGTSLTMGAETLAGIAFEIETKGKANNLNALDEDLQRLERSYYEVRQALQRALEGE